MIYAIAFAYASLPIAHAQDDESEIEEEEIEEDSGEDQATEDEESEDAADDADADAADEDDEEEDLEDEELADEDLEEDSDLDTEDAEIAPEAVAGVPEEVESGDDELDLESEDDQESAESPEPEELPSSLLAESDDSLIDLGSDPSDLFFRIPLRPPMSEANWRKLAGPNLAKIYRINNNDSLWRVSQVLFGSPYLWPKVWQLNAHITNPHFLVPAMELEFLPGNQFAAPQFALRGRPGDSDVGPTPPLRFQRILTAREVADQRLQHLVRDGESEQLRRFFSESAPSSMATLPVRQREASMSYGVGDKLDIELQQEDVRDVFRVQSISPGVIEVEVVGRVSGRGNYAEIVQMFAEIPPGSMVAEESLTVEDIELGEELELPTSAMFVGAERLFSQSGEGLLVGAKTDRSIEPGAWLKFVDSRGETKAQGVAIRSNGALGTVYLFEVSMQ